MEQNVFTKLRNGEPVNMLDAEFEPAIAYMNETRILCQRINLCGHDAIAMQPLINKMLNRPLQNGTVIIPPLQVDFGRNVLIGANVYINHDLCLLSAGGITIDDNVQIGPKVAMITTSHDLGNRMTIRCRGIHICRNVLIGAQTVILPGGTIGENAVVEAGAVVSEDVEANTIVGGNPARFIRRIGACAGGANGKQSGVRLAETPQGTR